MQSTSVFYGQAVRAREDEEGMDGKMELRHASVSITQPDLGSVSLALG